MSKEAICTCTPSNRLASICGNCNPSLINKKKKDTKVLDFLKWCASKHIKLEIGLSATGMVALSISNCDDEKMFFCGFGKTVEDAVQDLRDSIVNLGHVPVKYDSHEIIYDFPWDK